MFLVNGFKANLIQHNRNGRSLAYDDEDIRTIPIKVIPYNADIGVRFGTYSVPDAKGMFKVRREVDIKEGDQIEFQNHTYSVIEVADRWLFNRIEYKVAYVK